MSGRIPQDFINDLLERVDIAEVIGARLELKRAGREYKALCPFHGEKTASFHVVPEKGFYHCFGCGQHGTALTFLLEHDRMQFIEAVEALAQMAGVEVPRDEGAVRRDDGRAKLLDVVDRADRWFRQQLRSHPERHKAVDYLRGRGVDGEVAKTFGIGYAPAGYHSLLPALGGDEAMKKLLIDAGLLAVGDEGREPYDRFRDRIIFPIRDGRGRTIAFGGRLLGDGKPKYLNSPETPLFHKGRELYGLWECRKAVRDPERVLLVEGYMDVVGLVQAGIPEACASLGTAATRDHLLKLFKVSPEVVFCFDGDEAGRRAAWKAVNTALEVLEDGVSVRLLFLPEGEDPDTLVRKEGSDAFRARIRGAGPLSEYLFDALSADLDMAVLDGRSRLAHRAMPLIEKMPGPVLRSLMVRRLAELAQMPAEDLKGILAARTRRADPPPVAATRSAGAGPGDEGLPTGEPDLSAYEGWADADQGADRDDGGEAPPGYGADYADAGHGAGRAGADRDGGGRGQARMAPPAGNRGRVRRSKEDMAAALLLRRPELARRVSVERLERFALLARESVDALVAIVGRLHEEPTLAPAALIGEQTGTPLHARLITLAKLEVMLDAAGMEAEFDEALDRLETEAVDARRRTLMARIRAGEASDADYADFVALKRVSAGVPPAEKGEDRPSGRSTPE
ncbi:MAG TPA: DNA primase [Pseudomonadales bacterium]|nr:DNA primase [Pseudomonadales bacterium]